MKVTIVGKRIVDFVNRETSERIEGVNLFYLAPGENVQGLEAVKLFIAKTNVLYPIASELDTSKPAEYDLLYDIRPRGRAILNQIKRVS